MKKWLTVLISLLFPLVSSSQLTKKVLILGIDGLRADALQAANTPNIDLLINSGIFSPDALNTDITISGPGWSAILCGVWSNKHQVFNNNFAGNNYANYPAVISYIESFDASLHTASIVHWGPINDWIVANHADYKSNVGSDSQVSAEAVSYLTSNNPDFLFLHFDDPDAAGHGFGFSPLVPQYINAIESVDSQIGPILQAIQQRPTYDSEDWLYLLSSDHGGLGTGHGGSSIEEQNIPFIASGNNVSPMLIEKESTTFPPPPDCLGNPVELHFDGDNDFVQVASNTLFDFGANQDFTIECRVRTNHPADVSIVGNKDWDSGLNKGFVLSFKYPSGPEWKVNIGDGSNRADINTGGLIADEQWHTLSVSFDRDGLMKMYEDGVFLNSTSISHIGNITTNQGLFFGADINSAYDYSGTIAEVRVWNSVLSDSEIQDWHCTSVTSGHPVYSDLIGYWKMDSDNGTNITRDESIHANHGTINGAVWEAPSPIIVDDYSSTPRLVDVPISALYHLCVPVQSSWGLDGNSYIAECTPTLAFNSIDIKVELIAQNQVGLKWKVNSPLNPERFEIQRSINAIQWNVIGYMPYQQASNEYYEFDDKSLTEGLLYYRIKCSDKNGTDLYSPIEQVYLGHFIDEVNIFPNPNSGEFEIILESNIDHPQKISVFNLRGQIIWETEIFDEKKDAKKTIHIPEKGIYFLRYQAGNHSYSKKIIVK